LKIPFGLVGSRSEAPEGDPRASGSFHDDRPEIQALFEAALEGRLPRARDLKPYEPQRLNERHLAMVMMRSGGLKQRQIAQAFGVTDSNASIVLNHPDAEYLLSRLAAMKATQPTDIELRLAALAEPAISTLEDAFVAEDPTELKNAMRRAPLAFRVLDMNGYGRKQKVEHEHNHKHQLDATPPQLAALASVLRESREIPEADYVVIESAADAADMLAPGGESTASPQPRLSPDTGAPSISDPQELPS
jgi:hypothetical protein